MIILYGLTGMAVIGSFLASRSKTKAALIIACKRFGQIMPAIIVMLAMVSCMPVKVMVARLFNGVDHVGSIVGMAAAALTGSVMMLPGFIVFPLCGAFAQEGVPYYILSAMTTTMMMVGVVTFPVEKSYLGVKLALARNLFGLVIAVVVAAVTGIVFGEF